MQKINKKASILIWSIFLSLIISISFLSISTKITKNLKNNDLNNANILEENRVQNILKTSENDIEDNTTEEIWNNTIYIENKILKKSLKKDEIYSIKFPTTSNITLKLTSSGVLLYAFSWTINDSWILKNNNNKIENNTTWIWNLILTNYSWYVSFELISNNKFDIPEKKYKIIEKIWNKEIIKSMWIIK